jgi:hypothetical protein
MTALSEARAELAELEAKRANLATDVKEADALRAPFAKKRLALGERLRKLPLVAHTAGRYQLMTRAGVYIQSYDLRNLAGKKRADIADAIANGGVGINALGGVAYKAKGLAPRLRVPDPVAVKAFKRAVAASERADKRAREAQHAEDEALALVFTTGTKIELSELVEQLTTGAVAQLALDAHPEASEAKHQLSRLLDERWGELTNARRHVKHLANKADDPGCPPCLTAARDAAAAKERRDRITALPRRKFVCPDHKRRVLGYTERSARPEWIKTDEGEKQVTGLPVLWCPVDFKRFIDSRTYEADLVKAAKLAKRAQARTAKAVTFVCPNPECEETVTAVPEGFDRIVTCDVCGAEWRADVVKTVKPEKAAA